MHSQMEGMVTDLALAREKQQLFSTWREGKNKGGVDVVVTVLTTGFWPHYKVRYTQSVVVYGWNGWCWQVVACHLTVCAWLVVIALGRAAS